MGESPLHAALEGRSRWRQTRPVPIVEQAPAGSLMSAAEPGRLTAIAVGLPATYVCEPLSSSSSR